MIYRNAAALTAIVTLAACTAFAQDATDGETIAAIYSWACSNQNVVQPTLEVVLGLWGSTHLVSALMKKAGVTKDSPWIGRVAQGLRIINADVKPPEGEIVRQSAIILANKPEIAAATGADPNRMAAAADAIKNAAKS